MCAVDKSKEAVKQAECSGCRHRAQTGWMTLPDMAWVRLVGGKLPTTILLKVKPDQLCSLCQTACPSTGVYWSQVCQINEAVASLPRKKAIKRGLILSVRLSQFPPIRFLSGKTGRESAELGKKDEFFCRLVRVFPNPWKKRLFYSR